MRYDQVECTGTAFWCTTQHSTSVRVKWTTQLARSHIHFPNYTSIHKCSLVIRKRLIGSKKVLGPVTWSWRGKKLHERRQRRQAPRWGHSSAGRVDRNEHRAIWRLSHWPNNWHGRATNPRVNNNRIAFNASFAISFASRCANVILLLGNSHYIWSNVDRTKSKCFLSIQTRDLVHFFRLTAHQTMGAAARFELSTISHGNRDPTTEIHEIIRMRFPEQSNVETPRNDILKFKGIVPSIEGMNTIIWSDSDLLIQKYIYIIIKWIDIRK